MKSLIIVLFFSSCFLSESQIKHEHAYKFDNVEESSNFKKEFREKAHFLSTDCQNEKAQRYFSKQIDIIKESVNNKDGRININEVARAIVYLERVTKINSTSDSNYFGRYSPTKEDYEEWEKWFKKNFRKMCWEDTTIKSP
ncbi:hypothetical protein [Flavivirga spongiicola]|uniref:EF-hand domain-containing protein n=1 Tax=Flavivirga spongiicola TaxID=421621 RepID=A0ABU7XLW2_9FLAO|nr:hypothetical protein [Flavivirga sp. MEBiC05379]MDO5981402.1 hypothetical protein [Flavivirga sp. MEBiC05379]